MNIVLNDYLSAVSFTGFGPTSPLVKHYQWLTDVARFTSGKEQRNQILEQPIRHWFLNYEYLDQTTRDKLIELFQRAKGRFTPFLFEDPDEYEIAAIDCTITQAKIDIVTATAGGAGAGILTVTETATVTIDDFLAGKTFAISGSTGNDEDYTVDADATSDGTTITIIPTEALPDGTDDGHILRKEFQLFGTYYSSFNEEWTENRTKIQPGSTFQPIIKVNTVTKTETTHYNIDDTIGMLVFTDTNAPSDTFDITANFRYYFEVRFNEDIYKDNMMYASLWQVNGLKLIEVI